MQDIRCGQTLFFRVRVASEKAERLEENAFDSRRIVLGKADNLSKLRLVPAGNNAADQHDRESGLGTIRYGPFFYIQQISSVFADIGLGMKTVKTQICGGHAVANQGRAIIRLFRKADAAMYQAKRSGKNECCLYQD